MHSTSEIAPRQRSRAIRTLAILAALATAGACAGRRPSATRPSAPSSSFTATAYCTGELTAAGTKVARGIVAADPAVLPLGTVIRIDGLSRRYDGVYRVLDTGRSVRGRQIDVYVGSCREAIRFGRRTAVVSVIRRAPVLTR